MEYSRTTANVIPPHVLPDLNWGTHAMCQIIMKAVRISDALTDWKKLVPA